jgi:hypothetical protein
MYARSRARVRALALGFAAVVGLGSIPLVAQEPSPGKPADAATAPAATKTSDPTRRVPSFFGQIGLTPEQKEEIYKIRARHQARITDLQKQVAKAQAELLAECESVLNDTQKKLLSYRREAAAKARKAAAAKAPAEAPAPAKTAEKNAN